LIAFQVSLLHEIPAPTLQEGFTVPIDIDSELQEDEVFVVNLSIFCFFGVGLDEWNFEVNLC